MKKVHKEGDGKPLSCAVSHLQDLPLFQILNQHDYSSTAGTFLI